MTENNETFPKPVSAMSVVDGVDESLEDNETILPSDTVVAPEGEEDVTSEPEEPLRVSDVIPLVMTRKNDKVVIGTAVVKVYEGRAELFGTISGTEEAGEAAGLFSSNIVGGISIGAILTPEAAAKLSEHLNS